ncbi:MULTISPECIES: DUF317 domain-containing protein [Streptomyces]|uniref:DUF317 domain-containing protein n=1 Tax=Streptomyces TaxID=1883 RepID=UPI003460D0C5
MAADTDALTDPAPAATTPSDPYEPLRRLAWTPPAIEADGLVSPDGTVYVQRLGSAQEPRPWFVTAKLGRDRPMWQARFDAHTPPRLITAFTTALTDPYPVARIDGLRSLPTLDPNIVTRESTNVLAVRVATALEDRVRSLAARRASPPTSPVASRQPPAKNNRRR